MSKSMKLKKELGLYIHIPFCVRKCDYCDFLSAPASEDTKKEYIRAVLLEILGYEELAAEYSVSTIYFGGGTPSSIEGRFIREVMEKITQTFSVSDHPEVTIEVNPGTVTPEKFHIYKTSGINRISFGLQSADNAELKLLGRIHSYEEFEANYYLAREAGFGNINIDLMSALPGQTLQKWMTNLEKAVSLKPEHLSAYSLILEEGTPFYTRYSEESQDEELDRLIYAKTKESLEGVGYYRYEISNYAKPGYESRHNSSYWKRKDYLGIGLGASSLIHNVRYRNEDNLKNYIKLTGEGHDLRKDVEQLTEKEQMEEFMFLGLRMDKGINTEEFKELFHQDIGAVYGRVIDKAVDSGLLILEGTQMFLSDKGIDLSNGVMAEFLLD